MRKIILSVCLLAITTTCFAQKIKVSEIDKFTKQKRIETNLVMVKQGLSCGLGFTIRSVDKNIFINVLGLSCAVGVIGDKEKCLLLLNNDTAVTVYSTGIQSYDTRPSQYGSSQSYNHQYSITLEDLNTLANSELTTVRRYYNNNYSDIEVPSKANKKLQKLVKVFLEEFLKEK